MCVCVRPHVLVNNGRTRSKYCIKVFTEACGKSDTTLKSPRTLAASRVVAYVKTSVAQSPAEIDGVQGGFNSFT